MTLIGYWPLNESSGDAIDHSGNSNHGSTSGGVTYGATGPLSQKSYSFDGNDDYVDIDTPQGAYEAPFTYSCWIYIRGSTGENQYFVANGAQSNSEGASISYRDSTNDLGWIVQYNSIGGETNANISFDKWHSVVGTWDGSTKEDRIKLYVDGELRSTSTASSNTEDPRVNTTTFGTPNNSKGDYVANGKISEVRIYDRPLTTSEVQYLYSVGKRGLQTTRKKTS